MKRRYCVVLALVLIAGCESGGGGDRTKGQKPGDTGQEALEPQTGPAASRPAGAIREAAVAGLFYPSDKGELINTIEGFLADVDADRIADLRALICPHAGYRYSGPTAAFAYKQLRGRDIKTAIVLAPSHYARFEGASIADAAAYRTPLGLVRVSPLADQLARTEPFVRNPRCKVYRPSWAAASPKRAPPTGQDTPHTWEHSLEVQLPFLQRVLKDFELVPVVLGEVDPQLVAKALASRLGDRTILIASSDLSHQHPYDDAVRMDGKCIKAIRALDAEGIDPEYACGRLGIQTIIYLAKEKGWKVRLLDYRNSGDTAGPKSSVVGYAAIAFYGGKP